MRSAAEVSCACMLFRCSLTGRCVTSASCLARTITGYVRAVPTITPEAALPLVETFCEMRNRDQLPDEVPLACSRRGNGTLCAVDGAPLCGMVSALGCPLRLGRL